MGDITMCKYMCMIEGGYIACVCMCVCVCECVHVCVFCMCMHMGCVCVCVCVLVRLTPCFDSRNTLAENYVGKEVQPNPEMKRDSVTNPHTFTLHIHSHITVLLACYTTAMYVH